MNEYARYHCIDQEFLSPGRYMKLRKYKFEVEKLESRVEFTDDELDIYVGARGMAERTVYVAVANILKGGQHKVSRDEYVLDVYLVPTSAWQWLKTLIVEFEPTLNFGWLKPKLKPIPKTISVRETYFNVIPAKINVDARGIDWLEAEPPTRQEVSKAAKLLAISSRQNYLI